MTNRSQTSLDAYEEIGASGLLARSQFAVYDLLFGEGPLTRNEIDTRCSKTGKPNPAFSRRLVELERRGVLCRVGTKVCPISERECDLWDVTDQLPTADRPPPRPRVKAIIRDLAQGGPYFDAGGDCMFCEERSRGPIGHKPTCIWRRAKAVTDP